MSSFVPVIPTSNLAHLLLQTARRFPERPAIVWRDRVWTWADFREYADFTRDFVIAVRETWAAGQTVDEAMAGLTLPERYKSYNLQAARATIDVIYTELKLLEAVR